MKWTAILTGLVVIGVCFFPWVFINSKDLTLTGVDTTGTNYGKPAYFHFFLVGMTILLILFNRSVAHKIAIFFAAFNISWAIRNYFIFSGCQMGECPVKQPAIYILVFSSLLFLVFTLLQRTKEPVVNKS